jgi:hypothetical protein
MKPKFVLLVMFLTACLTTWAWAQEPDMPTPMGGFYGTITFYECECLNPVELVRILPAAGGDPSFCGVDCNWPNVPGYNTLYGSEERVFAPGSYYIGYLIRPESGCDHTFIRYVNHGQTSQEVNLEVFGPDGGETK